jgi:hypothetical protein
MGKSEKRNNKRRTETKTFSRANKKKKTIMVRTCNKDGRGEETKADIRS